jgi:sterol desaturase/sphingolipid hydroxylase (fatty acid hydroxylase superfamily)
MVQGKVNIRMASRPYPSIRIFKSDFCERFTHVDPITPLLLWVPVIAYLYYRSFASAQLPSSMILGISALGFVVWTLTEYLLHRFIFHFPAESAFAKRFMFIIHGLHHDDPNDPTRLVMPPFAGIVIGIVLFTLFRVLLGSTFVLPFFGAFLIGYLCYDYTHFAIHHFSPRTDFGRYVKQNHMNHHYVNHSSKWGVSSPIWDFVFGTFEASKRTRENAVPEQHGS